MAMLNKNHFESLQDRIAELEAENVKLKKENADLESAAKLAKSYANSFASVGHSVFKVLDFTIAKLLEDDAFSRVLKIDASVFSNFKNKILKDITFLKDGSGYGESNSPVPSSFAINSAVPNIQDNIGAFLNEVFNKINYSQSIKCAEHMLRASNDIIRQTNNVICVLQSLGESASDKIRENADISSIDNMFNDPATECVKRIRCEIDYLEDLSNSPSKAVSSDLIDEALNSFRNELDDLECFVNIRPKAIPESINFLNSKITTLYDCGAVISNYVKKLENPSEAKSEA